MIAVLDPVAERVDAARDALGRLAELMELKAGWLDGDGDIVSPWALAAAILVLRFRPELRDQAGIYPTPSGGISFEFEMKGWDLSIECSRTGAFELHGVDLKSEAVLGPKRYTPMSLSLFTDIEVMFDG